MSLALAVVCEAPPDRQTACELADRAICHHVNWITAEELHIHRCWCGFSRNENCLLWRHVPALARDRKIPYHGHFGEQRGELDAAMARKVLLLLNAADPQPHAVLLIRDSDGKTQRRKGLEQAREDPGRKYFFPIVIGLAHTKRECWVLLGFQPNDEDEKERLARLRQELGFDPTRYPEKLTAKGDSAKRSAKRVLKELTGGDKDRQAKCWRDADLQTLSGRGGRTGLEAYLQKVQRHLVPLFTGHPERG